MYLQMHDKELHRWQHSHVFDQATKRPGENRTLIVIAITGAMMVVEIVAGLAFGSMALLADGLHMASHAAALGIAAFAYVYARRHASDSRYSFGTGKVNALGGFSGAVLLAVFALVMAAESIERLFNPVQIAYTQAILVAVVGLLVNGGSMVILGHGNHHQHHATGSDHHHGAHHDHNLRSAYLHVLADALTSLLAIFALLSAKYFGFRWMDPFMGIVGAVLVARWSLGLMRTSGSVLLDKQEASKLREAIVAGMESDSDTRVADLHLWSIGPGINALMISLVSSDPRTPDYYKELIPAECRVAHATVEVHRCTGDVVHTSSA
jgi:cation diffusion facilitator family transporter